MTMFIDDLVSYLELQTALKTLTFEKEFYNEALATELICVAVYDSNSETGKYSIQFLSRYNAVVPARDNLFKIYNHFFNFMEQNPVYKEINGTKCLFKPLTKPVFLKKENGLMHYVMNVEVWTQKN